MKTTNHTPGPWAVTFGKYNASIHTDVTISRISDEAHAWKANAHLIAAAPDLLSALQECVRVIAEHTQYDDDDDSAEGNARLLGLAAIAKAEGVK